MKSIRLLPIVVLAASALLVLKTAGLVTGGSYALTGIPLAMAQNAAAPEGDTDAETDSETEEGFSAEDLAAAEAAAAAMFESTPDSVQDDGIAVMERSGDGGAEPLASQAGRTQDQIFERLSERRAELDALEAELDERLSVVEAAEVRIEERMSELAAVEARINAAVDAREAEEDAKFAGVVAMYEGMRPRDAATIFNELDMSVLVRVGQAMNPRKFGPILAEMTPARAQELTVRLAQPEDAEAPDMAQTGAAELPQIVGE